MLRDGYVESAAVAARLIAEQAVLDRWEKPSVLPGYPLGALVGHLARNIVLVEPVVTAPAPVAPPPIPVIEHYTADTWLAADPDDDEHRAIRGRGAQLAEQGPQALLEQVDATVHRLRALLAAEPADRVVELTGMWNLTLDDYLLTRLVEIVVHVDDIAVTAGLPTPDLPPAATDAVVALLARLAVWRHGPTAVVRALARRERAPEHVAAI